MFLFTRQHDFNEFTVRTVSVWLIRQLNLNCLRLE